MSRVVLCVIGREKVGRVGDSPRVQGGRDDEIDVRDDKLRLRGEEVVLDDDEMPFHRTRAVARAVRAESTDDSGSMPSVGPTDHNARPRPGYPRRMRRGCCSEDISSRTWIFPSIKMKNRSIRSDFG